jgi:cytochrome c-type biogenesis protein CcmH/NrfF
MKQRILIPLLIVLIAALSLGFAGTVLAQGGGDSPELSPQAEEIANNLVCTSCEGQSLNTCTTPQCAAWQTELETLVAEGNSTSYIYRHFANDYSAEFANVLVRGQFGDTYPPNVNPNDVYYIAEEMYCDVCAGVALAYCISSQCQVWREEIGDMLADGSSEHQIRATFADRYGEKIAAVPIDEGDRFLSWALPLAAIAFFALLVGWQFLSWQRKQNDFALNVARQAGTSTNFDRPVPDNVDPALLSRVLDMVEEG